jgi:hypothetical protein
VRRLLLFFRPPRLGRVKTRLAAAVGAQEALRHYRGLLRGLLERLEPLRSELLLYAAEPWDDPARDDGEPWLRGREIRLQRGADLGERMAGAFAETFAAGAERVLLAGSDIPDFDAALAELYFRELANHPMVLGPARDGGYYLIGFRPDSFRPEIFRGPSWGSQSVARQTLEAARSLGLDCYCGQVLQDIDTGEDLRALRQRSKP